MKKTKLKGCASLALALALVLPTTTKAASPLATTDQASLEMANDSQKEKRNISSQVQMSLDETSKVATYTINIEKANEIDNLKAIFYIRDESNLANLEVISDDNIREDQVKVEDSLDGRKISVDLKNATSISLRADVREGKEDKLVFNYILANEDETGQATKRVISSINKDQEGKASLKEQEVEGLGSILGGKFVDASTIEWSDFLVNQAQEDMLTNYSISLSDGQTEPEKLHIQTYRASKDGFVSEASHDLDFGDIENLFIPAGGAAKISLKTKVEEDKDTFTANCVELNRESTEKSNKDQIESLTEQINENDAKIKEEIKKLDQPPAKETTDNDVENLIKEINETDRKIKSEMQAIDKEQASVEKEVDVVVLNDKISENTVEKSPANEKLSQAEVDSIITDLDNRTLEIQKTMQAIDKEYGASLAKTNISAESESPDNVIIADIIKDLDDRNQAIQDELEKIYGKYAVDSVMDLSKSIDNETYELITGVDKNNDAIQEIIDQVNLSIETNKVLDNEEELASIKALLDNVEKLAENNEQALDKVEEKDRKEENSQNFKKVVPGYSEKVYKDLEKVVTVTLDPLKAPQDQVDKETATKSYPTIAKYLEELTVVKDLLK